MEHQDPRLRVVGLVAAMALAILAVTVLAYEDVRRQSAASMADFAQDQETLAQGLSLAIRDRLRGAPAGAPPPGDLLAEIGALERPGLLRVLLLPPGMATFFDSDGRQVPAAQLAAALQAGRPSLLLSRAEAAGLGLPRRSALAGLARADTGRGAWGVAAVATAWRERDRERHAGTRALLTTLIAAGLVLAFGGVALRMQRSQLRAQRALEIEDLRRRRDELLERASRAATLGTLAMGITHELSTPIGIIGARADQLLGRLGGDERAQKGLRVIQEQVERVGEVIRGLLGLARGQSPATQDLRPDEIVEGAVSLVAHRFAEAGVRLSAELSLDLPPVRGDRRLLEHAFVNLLLNACDACRRDGHVAISAEARAGQVSLAVTDNGVGISRADADRALEPFFTTKAAGEGSGLGLAVAHEILKSHRGALRIAPRDEGGTYAAMFLPIAPSDRGGDGDAPHPQGAPDAR